MILGSLAWWFSPYLLHGRTFISEAGQMLWADWVLGRRLLFTDGGISEWNPSVLFGVDWVGREAFLNPLNLGALVGYLLPGDKFAFMASTMLFLALMGVSMYAFLRALAIRPAFARIGTVIYLLAPKWVDDGYHGPRFVVGYAILPLTLLLIVRMREAGFRMFTHFVLFAALVSLTYLGLGASFLVIQAYLVATFFFYMLYLSWRDRRGHDTRLLLRTAGWLTIALVLIAALSAYVMLPFLRNYSLSERSAYGEGPGWGGPEYLGLVFPWINRIYSRAIYDLPYPAVLPILYPNLYFYVGVLAVPLLAMGFARRLWTPVTRFFAFAFLAWLALWNRHVIAVFPLVPWLDRLTQGNPSQYQGHIILIVSMSVVAGFVLQEMYDRREDIWAGRAGRYLGWLNRGLIAIYLSAAAAFLVGALVLATDLKTYIWPRVAVGHYVLAHYYFREAVATFVTMFLVRAAVVWTYHRRCFISSWGQLALLVLLIADFQLTFRTWMPFTDLDERYATDRLPNSFVMQNIDALDRIGASQYSLAARSKVDQLKTLALAPAPPDYDEVVRRFRELYYDGYRMPLYEPGFSYFPIAAGRSFYGYHESVMPSYFFDFDAAMNSGQEQYSRQSWIGVWDPHSPLLDLAGIKYLFWHDKIADPRFAELARYNNHSYVYLNRQALPRTYLVSRVEYFPSRRDLMRRIQKPDFKPREAAATEDPALYNAMESRDEPSGGGTAVISEYTPNRVTVAVNAGAASVLVLTDMHHPNWTAQIDGTATSIYRVNGIFRGVVVPAGESTVEFAYYNRAFHRGLVISTVSWAGVVVAFAIAWVRRR